MSQLKSKDGAAGSAKPASLGKAVSLHLEGKLQEALNEMQRVLESGDASLEAFSAKAQIQFELEMFEEAAQSYAKLLSMHPKHATANLNLAICMERLGRWQEAADFFEKAATADPSRTEPRLGLAIAQLHLDKPEAAATNFDQILSPAPRTIPPPCLEKPSHCNCSDSSMKRRTSTSRFLLPTRRPRSVSSIW